MSGAARGRGRRWLVAIAFAGAAAAAGIGCKTREDDFYDALYYCDPDRPERCGTTRTGEPMTCFAAEQLGGKSFCAPACDPTSPAPSTREWQCVSAGALLRTCDPYRSDGCPAGLACYRTSLLTERGVCVAAPVCDSKGRCPNRDRPVCADIIWNQLAPGPLLAMAGFQCLEGDCIESGCSSKHEFCLGDRFEYDPPISDLCLPRCTGDGHCPPNFSCQQNLDDALCVPGLAGARCISAGDCLVGDCVQTSAEFKICSIACSDDQSGTDPCAFLNGVGTVDPFICVHPAGAPSYCANARSFTGSACDASDHGCPAGRGCHYLPDGRGECQLSCDQEPHVCPERGGLGHTCIEDDGKYFCSPGVFGKHCSGLSTPECISGLQCLPLGADLTIPLPSQDGPAICTIPCPTHQDEECQAHTLIGPLGFCGPDDLCRLRGAPGAHCTTDPVCRAGLACLDGECLQNP